MAKKNTHYCYVLEDSGSTYAARNPDDPMDVTEVTLIPGLPVPQESIPESLAKRLLEDKHIAPCAGPGDEDVPAPPAAPGTTPAPPAVPAAQQTQQASTPGG